MKRGGEAWRTVTLALALAIAVALTLGLLRGGDVLPGVPSPPGRTPPPGITTPVFVSVPFGALDATRSVRWKLVLWCGRSVAMTRHRMRRKTRSLRVARTNVMCLGMRSQIHRFRAVWRRLRLVTVIR